MPHAPSAAPPVHLHIPDEEPALPEILRRLEIPECDCDLEPVPCECDGPCECPWHIPPCPHIRCAGHDMSLAAWAETQELHDPEHFEERPEPLAPALTFSHEARVELYVSRAERGFSLWHRGDKIRHALKDTVEVGPQASRGENSALLPCGVTTQRRA